MNLPKIRPANRDETAAVALVVATAFYPLDVCQWLTPDVDQRLARMPGYFRIVTEHAFDHGTVQVAADLSAVGVWLSVPFPDIPDYDRRLAAACGPWTDRYQLLDAAMHHAHPSDRGPHDYLAFLAVLPEYQRHGLGTALLAHRHATLDAAGRPSYLEASNSRSRNLYTRHGYLDCGAPLDLPYRGERMYPMWRNPQPASP